MSDTKYPQNNWQPAAQFAVQYGALVFCMAIIGLGAAAGFFWFLTALLVASAMVAAMYAAAHETLHRTAFRSAILNTITYVIATSTILYIPTCHRYFHLAHHRFTRDPYKDPEVAFGGEPTGSMFTYAVWLSGLSLLGFKCVTIFRAVFGRSRANWEGFFFYVPERRRADVRREASLILVAHGTLLGLGLFWMPSLLWVFVAQILGHALVSIQTAGDHNGLQHTGGTDQTRTFAASAVTNFIFWNMPYHSEHHAFPNIPYYHLPIAHRDGLLDFVHTEPSYPAFHADVLDQIKSGAAYVKEA